MDDGEQEIFRQDRLVRLRFLDDEFEDLFRLRAEDHLQRRRLLFAGRDDLPDLRAHSLQREPELVEDPHQCLVRLIRPGQACQPEKQMLCPDVAVAHANGLVLSEGERVFRAITEALHRAGLVSAPGRGHVAGRRRSAGCAQKLEHLCAHRLEREPERLEDPGRDALALVDEPEQDVLRLDFSAAEVDRFRSSELDHLLGARRKRDLGG